MFTIATPLVLELEGTLTRMLSPSASPAACGAILTTVPLLRVIFIKNPHKGQNFCGKNSAEKSLNELKNNRWAYTLNMPTRSSTFHRSIPTAALSAPLLYAPKSSVSTILRNFSLILTPSSTKE